MWAHVGLTAGAGIAGPRRFGLGGKSFVVVRPRVQLRRKAGRQETGRKCYHAYTDDADACGDQFAHHGDRRNVTVSVGRSGSSRENRSAVSQK
jgi:hypothetical protein